MSVVYLSLVLTWYGHATFTLATPDRVVVIDPYTYKAGLFTYPTKSFVGDVVTVSHNHFDHANVGAVHSSKPGKSPLVLRGLSADGSRYAPVDRKVGTYLRVRSVNAYHDEEQGKKRGKDAIFVYEAPGPLRIAHLGDLGQKRLTPAQLKAIGHVDVVLAPIGGYFTARFDDIKAIIAQLDPWVVIPMHYKTKYTQRLPISARTECPSKTGKPPVNVVCNDKTKLDLVPLVKSTKSQGRRQIWVYMKFVE